MTLCKREGTLQSSQTVPQGQVLFKNSKLESGFVLVSALAGRGVNSAIGLPNRHNTGFYAAIHYSN